MSTLRPSRTPPGCVRRLSLWVISSTPNVQVLSPSGVNVGSFPEGWTPSAIASEGTALWILSTVLAHVVLTHHE